MKFRAKRAAGEVRKPSIPESGWQPPLPQPAVVPPQRPVPAGGAVLPSNSAQSANAPTAGAFAPQPAPVDQAANDSALIRASLSVVEPHAANLPGFFYATLFGRYPQVRELFPPDMDVQHDRLLRALLMIVDLVDDPANLARFCEHLGRDHRKFGTESAHYAAVGECLLATLAHYAGPAWNAGTAAAWSRAYTTVAEVMDQAARADAAIRPAVWGAQIVAHHRHGDEIAELTVRTDQPYPFVGGQYVSVATPWWPKLWRYLSPPTPRGPTAPSPSTSSRYPAAGSAARWCSVPRSATCCNWARRRATWCSIRPRPGTSSASRAAPDSPRSAHWSSRPH